MRATPVCLFSPWYGLWASVSSCSRHLYHHFEFFVCKLRVLRRIDMETIHLLEIQIKRWHFQIRVILLRLPKEMGIANFPTYVSSRFSAGDTGRWYLQRGPRIAENKSTTHRTHTTSNTHTTVSWFPFIFRVALLAAVRKESLMADSVKLDSAGLMSCSYDWTGITHGIKTCTCMHVAA